MKEKLIKKSRNMANVIGFNTDIPKTEFVIKRDFPVKKFFIEENY